MSEQVHTVLEKIQRHLFDVDHHWCELITLGLELNRSGSTIPSDVALIHDFIDFKKKFAAYTRELGHAALISDKAHMISIRIKIEQKHQEKQK